ncbi:MAG: sigma-70 family RNA polymerase sigma factor [Clostridia bacterium]|nr:sigma-70 family RNA polymerase sigma factor [Clostridia bacterium]
MEQKYWFDSYDFSRNEYGFSAEELDTVRSLLSEGKQVWMAPMVIEDERQLKAMGLSRSRCRTWRSGREKRLVYLTPANKETFIYLKQEMDAVRKRAERNRRCLIPGTRNDYVRCPECYRCDQCPFGRGGEIRTGRMVSRDLLMESERETAVCRDTPEKIILEREMIAEVKDRMRRKNERILQAFELKEVQGLDVREVAERLGDTSRNVYYYVSEAKRIAREYREEYME